MFQKTLQNSHSFGIRKSTLVPQFSQQVDINSFLLGQVSNSWSRQGFSTKCGSACGLLITWRRSCNLIFNLLLSSHCICWGSLLCCLKRMSWFSCINFFAALFIYLQNDVSHRNNFIVAKVDLSYFSRGSRRNFCNKLVRENFTEVLILFQNET